MTGTKRFICTLVCLASVCVSVNLSAQVSECGKKRGVGPQALDETTWNRLNSAYEDVGKERYDDAYDKLEVLLGRARGKYLQAVLYQALAQVEWSRKHFDAALTDFEKAVELNALPDDTHFSLMYQIAQLYYMKDRYDDALAKLGLWMCKVPKDKVTAAAWMLKASIYAQKKDWKNVIPAVAQAISMSDDPKEPWYQLQLAAYFETEQFPKAAQTLETMIQRWPDKKNYWLQLSQIDYKLKRDDKALAVLALAYRRNMLDKQGDILYLANLYSNENVPLKAAEVLQKGLDDGIVKPTKQHWTMLADSWYSAEEIEKALAAYEKAGQASDDGEIDLRRAYLLVDLERWRDAAEAVTAALEKGGFNDRKTGDAYILLGMSEFNLGHYDKASTAWGRASRFPGAQKSAKQWMNLMREERLRKES